MTISIWFDAVLKTKRGKFVPYWDVSYVESKDLKETMWFHEGYGRFKEYRIHKVDEKNYIAESTNNYKYY